MLNCSTQHVPSCSVFSAVSACTHKPSCWLYRNRIGVISFLFHIYWFLHQLVKPHPGISLFTPPSFWFALSFCLSFSLSLLLVSSSDFGGGRRQKEKKKTLVARQQVFGKEKKGYNSPVHDLGLWSSFAWLRGLLLAEGFTCCHMRTARSRSLCSRQGCGYSGI